MVREVPTRMASPTNVAAPRLFDLALLRMRQARAIKLGVELFLGDRVAIEMAERLDVVKRKFTGIADIGSPGAALRKPSREKFDGIRTYYDLPKSDAEPLLLEPASLELVVSSLALQFVNDLPGLLAQIRHALKPDGLFLAVITGGDTLTELRQSFAAAEAEIEGGLSPRVIPFVDVRDAGSLLQRAGFALPVTDVDRITVRYNDAFALMQDLRRMGATNILVERTKKPTRRATLLRMAEIYSERFADPDGRIRATFDIIWLSGWAPHESQQKPLKPGSAKMSLADAVKRGEK
jgi:SAM-dependent methyltransferase